jgi:tRNA(Ile)-lysidine synthase
LTTDAVLEQRPQGVVALLDAARLVFPLELRPWRPGDRMRPIGLNGTKLISDILIDAKVPRHVKERTHVLLSGGEVVWLAGHRVAEGFQARPGMRQVVVIRWDPLQE